MMQLTLRAPSAIAAARRAAPVHLGARRMPAVLPARRQVVAHSAQDDTTTEDASLKVQEKVNSTISWFQTKWEQTEDSEKPAAVAIIIGSIVAQIAIGATVDAVDRLPFIKQFFELIGLAVVGWTAYKYTTEPAEREKLKKSLDSFVAGVTGDKK